MLVLWLSHARAWSRTPQSAPRSSQTTIVQFFTDDFWLNLHHFLYVLGRAEAKFPDSQLDGVNEAPPDQERGLASLGSEEQKIWRDVVTTYAAGLSRRGDSAKTKPTASAPASLAIKASAVFVRPQIFTKSTIRSRREGVLTWI